MTPEEISAHNWRHIARLMAQETLKAIPHLEFLERMHKTNGAEYDADLVKSLINQLNRLATATETGQL